MGDQRLTYSELDEQSDALAEALKSKGIGREQVVGLYVGRGLQMIVGLMGILKTGAAYLPLDPALPAKRIEYLLSDARVSTILTQADLMSSAPATASLLDIEKTLVEENHTSEDLEDDLAESTDLAYLIYTSGSTGAPKGTEVTQGNLVNLLQSMLREPGLDSRDKFVSVTTLSFDISALELFGPLMCGATLVVASREQTLDAERLIELLQQSGATVLQATPSTLRMLLDAGWFGKSDLRVWCGGEALSPGLANSLLERVRELWNLYGPTETTVWSSAHRVLSRENPILVGRPIANTQMYILDKCEQPVPIGVSGELYIAGDGVARGYWNQPELTTQRFLSDPFRPGGRMYRTGDLARYRRDGQIQLIGRSDHQIKLRGHRIELGEIEVALEQLDAVQQAVVAVQGDGVSQILVAYIRPAVEMPAADQLRRSLADQLPEYMVPASFVFLAEIPLTPNGKVDRERLPAPYKQSQERSTEVLAPGNASEKLIAAAWSDVLQDRIVNVHDNFFDLGGHSLMLTQVLAILRGKLPIPISIIDLFRYPTIQSLAAHLDRQTEPVAIAGVHR
jgi:amino acid adenylation domain-containing protein